METFIKASLQSLFQTIAQTQTKAELHQAFMMEVGQYFAAKRRSLYFLDQLPSINDSSPLMLKKALSLDHNPVLRYLVQKHAAVHDEVILPPGVWQTICPRADHGHVMVGPIISQGQLVGGIAVTRHRQDPKFTAENLADLNALCLHVSTRLAVLQTQPAPIQFKDDCLTPREAQIAKLVAQGMTNKEIGAELWITENSVKQALKRMFRKLKVSSRAEMVAQLVS
ncbi:response regulator containing a -like receiver domain protein and an hth dna-binding domain protein [Leptolyngbya sp. Heron Island J]|uniref:LuxR C-terminal-related transcriptional regulator n=1 Tax=Leptolyngbya sp. Heron Island J TaxID=1385935 RepID=UPI0003B98336|nr:LuxR C-terminal-related transcriptional regulator [Leptolyngbya sp. Heron Island J]ESA37016.1 response regulator containing a -like receiver domain protein and an hth dna-binding domain protein [Leptolyngbya sp. Heron Island J]